MPVSEPIFTKLTLGLLSSVKNFCAEFHEKPTNVLVVHVMSQAEMDGQTDKLPEVAYIPCKLLLKWKLK